MASLGNQNRKNVSAISYKRGIDDNFLALKLSENVRER